MSRGLISRTLSVLTIPIRGTIFLAKYWFNAVEVCLRWAQALVRWEIRLAKRVLRETFESLLALPSRLRSHLTAWTIWMPRFPTTNSRRQNHDDGNGIEPPPTSRGSTRDSASKASPKVKSEELEPVSKTCFESHKSHVRAGDGAVVVTAVS